MKHNITFLTLLFAFCFSITLNAQRDNNLQQANKEFDLHAYNLAIKSYRKVIEKNPDNATAYSGIGDCYRLLGRMAEAADWYKKALQLPDVDPVTLFHYGKTLMALGEYEKAIEWFLVYAEGQPVYGNHFAESSRFAISLRGMPGLYRVKKEFINTDASEFGPAFFKGNVVYSSARTDLARQMEKDRSSWDGGAKNQLFISGIDANGYLTKPSFLRSDLQNVYNEGPITYSDDGKWLAFAKNNFINGTRQIPAAGLEGSLFIASANENGTWNESIAFPHNGSGYSSTYPHLSKDGQKLYFASNRPDGYGGFDIYVSYRIGSTWTSPENLGPVVNSPGNEISPFMENGTLYFASDWHHGLGGMDLFKAVTEDGLWSKVFHLGNTINSPYDDYSLIINSKENKGYFVSNRKGGVGNEDIYQISKISEDALLAVTEEGTGKALPGATLDFTDCGSQVFTTDEFGNYRFQVFEGLACEVVIAANGYKTRVLKLDANNSIDNTYRVSLAPATSVQSETTLPDNNTTTSTNPTGKTGENDVNPNAPTGQIFNSRDNLPVADVFISAQAKNKATIKTKSRANGSYQLDLEPNTDYIIRYSKMGFLDTHQKIETGATVRKDALSVIMLNASKTNLEEKPEIVTSAPPNKEDVNISSNNDNTEVGTTTAGSTSSTTDSENTSTSMVDNNTNTAKEVLAQEGYAVQVAALKMDENFANDKYIALSGIGNLYSRPEKGMKKVRVGIYRSKEEAAEARKSIVAKGFSSAFVVSEKITDPAELNVFDSAPTLEPAPVPDEPISIDKPQAPANEKSTPLIPDVETTAPGASIFMVRLATYTKPEFFDDSKVKSIGKVEQRLKGNMTIMLLSGFPTLQAAREATQQAVKVGYSGAHVVMEENGKLIKI